jgi:hypothetical protein
MMPASAVTGGISTEHLVGLFEDGTRDLPGRTRHR